MAKTEPIFQLSRHETETEDIYEGSISQMLAAGIIDASQVPAEGKSLSFIRGVPTRSRLAWAKRDEHWLTVHRYAGTLLRVTKFLSRATAETREKTAAESRRDIPEYAMRIALALKRRDEAHAIAAKDAQFQHWLAHTKGFFMASSSAPYLGCSGR
jgi:hypothetical protein